MATPFSDDFKLSLLVFKEWLKKSSPDDAVKNINKTMSDFVISSSAIPFWYEKFDKNEADFTIFSAQNGEPKNLHNSLMFLSDRNDDFGKMKTKYGRFFVSSQFDKKLKETKIIVYDMFRGIKRTSTISRNIPRSSCTVLGNYILFAFRRTYDYKMFYFYALKINHDDLAVEKELQGSIDVSSISIDYDVIPDQLNDQRFLFVAQEKAVIGEIQENDDKIVLNMVKDFEKVSDINSTRLVGNKLQGFNFLGKGRICGTMLMRMKKLHVAKFCKIDLENMEKTGIEVPINLDDEEMEIKSKYRVENYCWSKDYFYAIYQMMNNQYQLFSFDPSTLKWANVKIWSLQKPDIFVDENEVMTLEIGHSSGACVYYRVALRKPDTLTNLTWFCALRQSNVYGNQKYFKNVQGLQL